MSFVIWEMKARITRVWRKFGVGSLLPHISPFLEAHPEPVPGSLGHIPVITHLLLPPNRSLEIGSVNSAEAGVLSPTLLLLTPEVNCTTRRGVLVIKLSLNPLDINQNHHIIALKAVQVFHREAIRFSVLWHAVMCVQCA